MRTNGQTYMTKLIVALQNFESVLKNWIKRVFGMGNGYKYVPEEEQNYVRSIITKNVEKLQQQINNVKHWSK